MVEDCIRKIISFVILSSWLHQGCITFENILMPVLLPGTTRLGQPKGLLLDINEVCLMALIKARISLAVDTSCDERIWAIPLFKKINLFFIEG